MTIHELPTPSILIDRTRLETNIRAMQATCDTAGVALWPHIKTHKLVPVLRGQLAAGAAGATCAKIAEAEAMVPSGVRRIFIAYSLAQTELAPRLRALADQLDELVLAVTSEAQLPALEKMVELAGLEKVHVLLAIDTGLHREGTRSAPEAAALARKIRASDRLDLRGLYTHEGHAYGCPPAGLDALVADVHASLIESAAAVGGDLPLWPGCSVTASRMAKMTRVEVIRPGAYVFGDLFLTEETGAMAPETTAAHVWATVVDRPEPGLALINAGSKVFSKDANPAGIFARGIGQSLAVTRLSEEHGFVTGDGVSGLRVGQRLRFLPAHICPVINLASEVSLIEGDEVVDTLGVDARGKSQ